MSAADEFIQAAAVKKLKAAGYTIHNHYDEINADPDDHFTYFSGGINGHAGKRKRKQQHATPYAENVIEFSPVSGATESSIRTQDSTIVFRPNRQGTGLLNEGWFVFTLTNTHASAVITPVSVFYFMKRIQYKLNGRVVQETGDDEMFYGYYGPMIPNEAKQHYKDDWNWIPGVGELALVAGATREFWVPIFHWFVIQENLSLESFTEDMEIVITMNNCVSSGPGVLSLVDLKLRLVEQGGPLFEKNRSVQVFKDMSDVIIPITEWTTFDIAQTLTAGVNNEIIMTGVRGLVPFMIVLVRANTTVPNKRNAVAIEGANAAHGTFDIVDPQGTSMYKIVPNGRWLRKEIFKAFPHIDVFIANHAVYYFNFARHPEHAIHDKVMDGFRLFTGDQKFRIRPHAGFASGNYTVTFMMPNVKDLKFNNGVFQSTGDLINPTLTG